LATDAGTDRGVQVVVEELRGDPHPDLRAGGGGGASGEPRDQLVAGGGLLRDRHRVLQVQDERVAGP
jgi:hypothetical protein